MLVVWKLVGCCFFTCPSRWRRLRLAWNFAWCYISVLDRYSPLWGRWPRNPQNPKFLVLNFDHLAANISKMVSRSYLTSARQELSKNVSPGSAPPYGGLVCCWHACANYANYSSICLLPTRTCRVRTEHRKCCEWLQRCLDVSYDEKLHPLPPPVKFMLAAGAYAMHGAHEHATLVKGYFTIDILFT